MAHQSMHVCKVSGSLACLHYYRKLIIRISVSAIAPTIFCKAIIIIIPSLHLKAVDFSLDLIREVFTVLGVDEVSYQTMEACMWPPQRIVYCLVIILFCCVCSSCTFVDKESLQCFISTCLLPDIHIKVELH